MPEEKFDTKPSQQPDPELMGASFSHRPPNVAPVPLVFPVSNLSGQPQPLLIQIQQSTQDRLQQEYDNRRKEKQDNQFNVILLFALGFLFPPLWIVSCVSAFRPRRSNHASRAVGVSGFVLFVLLAIVVFCAIVVAIVVPVSISQAYNHYYD